MGPEEYRDAWGWVEFMFHGPAPAGRELQAFIGEVLRGGSSTLPLGVAAHCVLPHTQEQFAAFFVAWRPQADALKQPADRSQVVRQ